MLMQLLTQARNCDNKIIKISQFFMLGLGSGFGIGHHRIYDFQFPFSARRQLCNNLNGASQLKTCLFSINHKE